MWVILMSNAGVLLLFWFTQETCSRPGGADQDQTIGAQGDAQGNRGTRTSDQRPQLGQRNVRIAAAVPSGISVGKRGAMEDRDEERDNGAWGKVLGAGVVLRKTTACMTIKEEHRPCV